MQQKEFLKVRNFFKTVERLMQTSRTVRDIFDSSTLSHPNAIYAEFFNERGHHKVIRYVEFRGRCFAYAAQLSTLTNDLPKGSIVGLKLKNSPEWAMVFWAILMNGFVPFLLDARASGEATDHFLAQAGAKAVIADDFHTYAVPRMTLSDLNGKVRGNSYEPVWENRVIFASSGTTGEAKLVIFDGENLCAQINAAYDMPNTTVKIMYPPSMGRLNILAFIPFHHIFGFVAVFLWYTFFGKTLVFVSELAPKEILNTCRKLHVTHIYAVPLFWDNIVTSLKRSAALQGPERVALLDKMVGYHTQKITRSEAGLAGTNFVLHKLQKKLLGKKIRYCISGGGALASTTLQTINGIGYPLYNGFGLTEVGITSVELVPEVLQRLKNSIGKPLFGIEYKILPSEKDNPFVGELLIKSATTHRYEIKQGEIVPTVLDKGYFHTGDIAHVDTSGNYWIKGRIKDIIINPNGENVYPDEIETLFKSVPDISNCAVLGMPSPGAKEKITLVLELSGKLNAEQLENLKTAIKSVNVTLPRYKQVETTYIIDDKLPLSASMKVQKFVLREWLTQKIDRFQEIAEARLIDFASYPAELIDSLLKKVRTLFAEALLLPENKLSDAGHFVNDFGGDSLSYAELISNMEEAFELSFSEEVFGQLASINDFVGEIAKQQTAKSK